MATTPFKRIVALSSFIVLCVMSSTMLLACSTESNTSSSEDEPAIAATVHIKDGEFDPRETDIEVGGSVMWINDDVATHDLKFLPPNKFFSGVIKPTGVWIHTFGSVGTYDYYCDFHNTMKGSVVVRPAS